MCVPWRRAAQGDPVGSQINGLSGDPAQGLERREAREMATETAEPEVAGAGYLELEDRIWLLRAMLLMRGIEERAMNLYRQGKVPGSFYDGFGQEAVSPGPAFAMAPQDRLCILHRDLPAHLIRGVAPLRLPAQYIGRDPRVTRGRDGHVP